MNISIDIRLDLSPAFAAAMQELTRALGGRGLPPPRPYEKPDLPNEFEPAMVAERPAPASPIAQVDTVADVEIPAEPKAETAPEVEAGPRWTDERNSILNAEYFTSGDRRALLTKLNALPGPAITSEQMAAIAKYRKWMASHKATITEPPIPAEDAPVRAATIVTANPQAVPIAADDATIRHWASARGLCNGAEPIDMDRINAKRVQLGLPPYRRVNGLQTSAGTLRSGKMGDAR